MLLIKFLALFVTDSLALQVFDHSLFDMFVAGNAGMELLQFMHRVPRGFVPKWIPEAVANNVDAISGANTAGAPGAVVVFFFLGLRFFLLSSAGADADA